MSTYISWGQQEEEREIGKTIDRFLSFLSFSDSSKMQVDSLSTVFSKDAKLVANFGRQPFIFNVQQFMDNFRNSVRSGQVNSSIEKELLRKVDVFGKIAHVLSTYELTSNGKDGKIVRRGLNSIQLLKQDGKWFIWSVVWDRENNDLKLPSKYLSQ